MAFELFTPTAKESSRSYVGVRVLPKYVYISIALARKVSMKQWKRITIFTDKGAKQIKFKKVKKAQGSIPWSWSLLKINLSEVLPSGRYIVEKESNDEIILTLKK